MIKTTIVASSWYLSSFSYMMHGDTYIKTVFLNNEDGIKVSEKISEASSSPEHCHYFQQ